MEIGKIWLKNIKKAFAPPVKKAQENFFLFISKNLKKKHVNKVIVFLTFINPSKLKYLHVETIEAKDIESKDILHQEKNRLCAAKPQYYYQKYDLHFFNEQNIYAALLNNATIFGSSNVVLVNGEKALYELLHYDKDNKFRYTDTAIASCAGGKLIIQYKESGKTIENGIMLSGNYSDNYYHFIYEILTRFFLLEKLAIPQSIPLIVDDVVNDVPQFKELLDYFNVENREIICLRKKYSYRVEKLHYLSLINIIPPNYKDVDTANFTDYRFNTRSIDFLRDKLLQKKRPANNRKRIFLSRQNASSRRRYNESEVLNIFMKHDFEVVAPEKYSIPEQVSLFNNADFIAGVTGAAFTNVLFCKRDCKIFCIQATKNDFSAFSTIAKYLKLDLQCFYADDSAHENRDIHDAFTVDLAKIEEVLVDFLRK